jgi:hypothetical protein
MDAATDLRPLPIEGMELIEWQLEGNGKDAELRIVAADGRRFVLGVSDPRLHTEVVGRVHAEIRAMDDVTLRIRYSAPRLILTEARIRYPGQEAEWTRDAARFEQGRMMTWAISAARFTLVGGDTG